jgi:hypothetical protein
MELISLILVSGVAGGAVVALLLTVAHRLRPGQRQTDAFAQGSEARRTDVINIASIRVAGVGGLGLVAMAVALAWSIPRIGQSMALGALLGAGFAAVLILWRRRIGPLPTSGGRPGANTALSIDEPVSPENTNAAESRNGNSEKVHRGLLAGRVSLTP